MFKVAPKDKWYAKAVEEAAQLGLMMGVGNGKFEPDRHVTRAEVQKNNLSVSLLL